MKASYRSGSMIRRVSLNALYKPFFLDYETNLISFIRADIVSYKLAITTYREEKRI